MKTAAKQEDVEVKVMASSLEALADNIATVSRVGKALEQSRLTRRAIVLLLRNLTCLSSASIETVLNALPRLEETFLKKEKKA